MIPKILGPCSIIGCGIPISVRGLCSPHYQRLRRRGTTEPKLRKYGTGTITDCGYHSIQVDGIQKAVHIRLAEKALGRLLPSGVVVHHANEDRLDNRPENLVICTQWYHRLLHTRINACKACGNPNWRKCKFCKKYDDPQNMRIVETPYKTVSEHRECHNEYQLRRYYARKAAVA